MNVPPLTLGVAERISEASLCFSRTFWQAQKFPGPVSIAEGEAFILGREDKTAEISPDGVIVSFIHKANLSSRRVPTATEANGCHYGFNEKLYTLVSQIGEGLKAHAE
jgi:hypothetical protein